MTVCSTQAHRADNNADRYRWEIVEACGQRVVAMDIDAD
jgi:hypothetical protein